MPEKNGSEKRSFEEIFDVVLEEAIEDISGQITEKGYRFLGIIVTSCPDKQERKTVLTRLRGSLSGLEQDNRKLYVHERNLDGKLYSDDLLRDIRIYRELHPYNILLVWDPKKLLDVKRGEAYSLDLEGCLIYDVNKTSRL